MNTTAGDTLNPVIYESLKDNEAVREIETQGSRLGNLYPMEEALLLAAAFQDHPQTYIVVKKNRYEAQQLFQRLEPLTEDVLLFVVEESLRVQSIAASPEDRIAAVDALSQCIRDPRPRILICNTAAFVRFLPDRDLFASLCFDFHVDMDCDMEQLKMQLNQAGYVRVNYVDRPGTFAARGGIVDIYAADYEHPIRIEFFDTVIESIRFFDENTQRTIKETENVQIGPAGDILFTAEQKKIIKEKVHERLQKEIVNMDQWDADVLSDHVEADLYDIENDAGDPRLYVYYSYVTTAQLTDYIHGTVIYSSKESVQNAYKHVNEENVTFLQESVQDHVLLPKYTMFHSLPAADLNFHEFLDYEHPLLSDIYPIEKANQSMEQILEQETSEQVYFAVETENQKKIESYLNEVPFVYRFIDAQFYEGFRYRNYAVYTEKELWTRKTTFKRYKKSFREGKMLEAVTDLQKGDYVVHEQYGIGQYLGIVTRRINNQPIDYLHILYRNGDDLYVPLSQFQLVRKYISKEGTGVHLSKLGSDQWKKSKEKVNQKVEEIAARLVDLYALRSENIGYAYGPDDALQKEFEDAFEYELTPDQEQATAEIKAEMEKPKPMDYLLCGDVGFGKTEVAMRCAFKVIENGKQVAFLCPTTILSMQHYQTVSERFKETGCNIALVNRFVKPAEVKQIQKDLKEGKIDMIIGTHKLLNKDFQYKDLGFLIVDEEQRFGVEHKERIKELNQSIDVLSLSATPIPRTLQMSLIGVRTISQLNTPPAQRHPIQTYIIEKRGNVIRDIIERELARGGQVFYLYNHISNIHAVAKNLQEAFPDVKVAVAHGQMERDDIEQTMLEFQEQKYQILVCTTIIETGLDMANANTIIIEDADRFGLSQLYQIRGRVGRRERIGYCYLMIQPHKELTEQANKRIKSIKEFTQLGSGYKIAMRDLTIRGAGDLLGPQQAGFIDQVGLDLYLEMLGNAIARRRGETVEEKKSEKTAQVTMNGYIPKTFTDSDGDKLTLYQDIRKLEDEKQLQQYEKRINDLYGRIPPQVQKLFERRRIDLFANRPDIEAVKETNHTITIIMDPVWSAKCNGVALFEAMNKISRKIQLTLKDGRIRLYWTNQKGSYDLLMKVIQEMNTNKEIYETR